ncbi:MAG: acyl-CoA dehydrogenase family protein [Planctomycetes bacterium]|nr:acyl-CoA dehydrogenase family protein [Planctomycetota bacterium]MCB9826292.1 acyl-CoA dehydrogenase family protein [Planctomycetota bacterium]MCB9830703.1 acyl-CoA dehydrogenase family protein [Planctomycetota bacterium]MCB9902680.1 acyl-CoA dehydrogenase family protein [Planctomycetota bacterium]
MDFDLTEDQRILQEAAREFAENELAPRAAASDAAEGFVREQIDLCKEMGFLGMAVSEAYGGSELGAVGTSLVLMEVNRCCASTGVTLSVHNSLTCESLMRFGSDEQKQRYLPKLAAGEWLGAYALSEAGSGSDAGSLVCKATKDGDDWVLDGTKLWISHGDQADLVVVFARTDADAGTKGITAFLVETSWDGYKPGKKEKKMGLRGSSTVELHLDHVRVPAGNVLGEVGRGFPLALSLLDTGRIGIASQAVGIAQACLEASIKYAREREQFGKPIGAFGAIQEKLADMATRVDAARLLTLRAASLKDQGKPHGREASMAKLFASRTANDAAKEAVQIHGGAGYTRDFPVERYFRDARVTEIYEGTTEIQRLVIARSLLAS